MKTNKNLGKPKKGREKARKRAGKPMQTNIFDPVPGSYRGRGVWGRLLEDFGRGLEDFERDLAVKTGGSNPKTSTTRISLFNLKFPYSPFLAGR